MVRCKALRPGDDDDRRLWGLWHSPLILLGYNFGLADLRGVALMTAGCIAWGILLGWSRLRTGSVWPAVVGHGALNASAGLIGVVVAAGAPLDPLKSTFPQIAADDTPTNFPSKASACKAVAGVSKAKPTWPSITVFNKSPALSGTLDAPTRTMTGIRWFPTLPTIMMPCADEGASRTIGCDVPTGVYGELADTLRLTKTLSAELSRF